MFGHQISIILAHTSKTLKPSFALVCVSHIKQSSSDVLLITVSEHVCDTLAKGGCSHTCEKDGENGICKCPEDMELMDDKKKCKNSKFVLFLNPHYVVDVQILLESQTRYYFGLCYITPIDLTSA